MSDYIKREDALTAILALEDRDIPEDRYPDTEFAFNEGLVHAASKVNDIPAAFTDAIIAPIPTVDLVERRRGTWVPFASHAALGTFVKCSECGKTGDAAWAGCPWCLAVMEDGDAKR